jgi:hypothetical protein
MKKKKYLIILFCNKKRKKVFYSLMRRNTIYDYWRELKTQKKPPFVKQFGGKRNIEHHYELALIFKNNRWVKDVWVKDSLGRNQPAIIDNNEYRIKEIIPYWEEELIYDFHLKKHIRYHEMMNKILPITERSQIFTLNNKLFIQVENDYIVFGNKNLKDTERLFDILKEELINKKRSNFIFVKDITTHQRKLLYDILEKKGFKRRHLFKHYSY